MKKVLLCWSGGKDSAMALHELQKDASILIDGLLTTISLPYDRISMHGVRRSLLEKQAQLTDFPLFIAAVGDKTNKAYEEIILDAFAAAKERGVTHIAFGDIFLEDLRLYREELLAKAELKGLFPLWKKDTTNLINQFWQNGFQTITCCVNDAALNESFCGRLVDSEFIRSLPSNVDPCGENGEFHTFCFDGPVFRKQVQYEKGEIVYRPLELKTSDDQIETKGFWYCDLI
jgi:uncharacterized protein (TIGR00290 family)